MVESKRYVSFYWGPFCLHASYLVDTMPSSNLHPSTPSPLTCTQFCRHRPQHRRSPWYLHLRSGRHRQRDSPTRVVFPRYVPPCPRLKCPSFTPLLFALGVAFFLAARFTTLSANPLRIITGRGTHSANGVGVLKPAVRNALVRDGWNVGVWDGGLVVRGRTSKS